MFTEPGQFFTSSGGYEIEQSIRFNKNDDAKLTKTFGTATNRRKFTLSVWQKNGSSAGSMLEYNQSGGSTWANITIGAGGRVDIFDYSSGSARIDLRTSRVFNDPSAWVHLVVAFDTTAGSAADRIKVYINGTQETSFGTSTYPSQDFDGFLNSAVEHLIGEGVNGPFDGYIAEYYFIDGQQLGPDSFGETNDDGVWIPKDASSLTFGTNGFYLKGQDSSALGDDSSGNGNDFTSSGLAAADQKSDTPTLNASTFNPLWAGATLSDGNLVATASGNAYQWATSTFAIDDGGKYVCEFQKSAGTFGYVGIFQLGNHNVTTGNNYMYAYNLGTGEIVKNASAVTDLGTGAANSLMRIEYDGSNDTIEIFDDGTEIFPASTGVSNTVGLTGHNSLHFGCAPYASGTIITATFQGLSGTPTTNFKELTSANLSTPTISDGSKYFQSTLYTGTGSSRSVDQSGNSTFQPDWVWVKSRGTGADHALYDAVRGVQKEIKSNGSDAEATVTTGLTAFESDGFQVGSRIGMNGSSDTFVAWQWLAGNTTGSSNTDGDITSTVTANTTSGFSIVTYSGNGSDNQEIGHGLGIAPKMIWTKRRDSSGNWTTYHDAVGINKVFYLNSTAVPASNTEQYRATPTSSVYTIGVGGDINNSSGTYVAYVFAEVEGYSSIGSYVGNGSATAGPFISTGFRPAFVITKNITNAGDGWPIVDSKRSPFNTPNATLLANLNVAETTGYQVDLYSNGFAPKSTDHSVNESGATIIYMAFAEHPFGGDGIAPGTAR